MKNLVFVFCLFLTQLSVGQGLMTPELLISTPRVSEPAISPDGNNVLYNIRSISIKDNSGNNDVFLLNLANKQNIMLVGGGKSQSQARWMDNVRASFIEDTDDGPQVFEINTQTMARKQITKITGGVTNYGIAANGSIWYSADVKMDKNPAEIYPDLPKVQGARIIDGLMYRHWNAWSDYTYSHVFVGKLKNGVLGGQGTDIMDNEKFDSPLKPFGGAEQITFSPDGNSLIYVCKKLNGTAAATSTNSDLYLYDLNKKTTQNLTEGMPGYDNNPQFSPDGKKLLWLSMEEAGYEADKNRLFVMSLADKKRVDLSANFDYPVSNAYFDKTGNTIYFIAEKSATTNLFSCNISNLSKPIIKEITNELADYQELSFTENGKGIQAVATKMSIEKPTEVYSVNFSDGTSQRLTFATQGTLGSLKMGKVEKRMIKTTDNKEMLTWVIYPPNFDPKKKYPTLLYCQGGPQSAVSQFFSFRWNFQMMAAKGYIVVAPNRRGLPSFGEKWNDQIAKDWGGMAMKDLLSAIDDVSKEPYVDKNHLGAVGASFGGFSVYWLAGNHDKRFKAFIAHCGVFNLESQYTSTEELFFANHDMGGPYWKNSEGYSGSPHRFVNNWDTPILVIHNEKDYRVPLHNGIEAFTTAQLQNIPSRFLYFPDEGHWVTKPQNAVLWQRVFFEWLDKYLKND